MSRQEPEFFPENPSDWQEVAVGQNRTNKSRPSTLVILGVTYTFLGNGACNWVYQSEKIQRIVKIPRLRRGLTESSLDRLDRIMRLSKENFLPKKFRGKITILQGTQYGDLFSAPKVSGVDANDAECASEVRRIFIVSGRAFLDASFPGNIRKDHDGELISVDYGQAIKNSSLYFNTYGYRTEPNGWLREESCNMRETICAVKTAKFLDDLEIINRNKDGSLHKTQSKIAQKIIRHFDGKHLEFETALALLYDSMPPNNLLTAKNKLACITYYENRITELLKDKKLQKEYAAAYRRGVTLSAENLKTLARDNYAIKEFVGNPEIQTARTNSPSTEKTAISIPKTAYSSTALRAGLSIGLGLSMMFFAVALACSTGGIGIVPAALIFVHGAALVDTFAGLFTVGAGLTANGLSKISLFQMPVISNIFVPPTCQKP